jgi:hypothetical protein
VTRKILAPLQQENRDISKFVASYTIKNNLIAYIHTFNAHHFIYKQSTNIKMPE